MINILLLGVMIVVFLFIVYLTRSQFTFLNVHFMYIDSLPPIKFYLLKMVGENGPYALSSGLFSLDLT